MTASHPNPVDITDMPLICGKKRKSYAISVPTNIPNCDMWNGAVQAMQNTSNAPPSGNYRASLDTCYRVNSDQVLNYGSDGVFDITALQKTWATDSGTFPVDGNPNCQKSVYGLFDKSTGASVFKGGGQPGSSSYGYWQSLQQQCTAKPKDMSDPGDTLYRCYSQDGKGTPIPDGGCLDPDTSKPKRMRVNSMIDDYNDMFSYVSGAEGGSSAVNFSYECRDPDQMVFTQCKVPGWDYMDYDKTKGWIPGDVSSCGQNPLLGIAPSICSSSNNVFGETPCDTDPTTTCGNNGGTLCTNDSRPNTVDGCPNCCDSCESWTKDFNEQGLFSHKQARDTTNTVTNGAQCKNPDGTTQTCTVSQLVEQACSAENGHVCIASATASDDTSNQVCDTCAKAAPPTDMSNAVITFSTGSTKTITLPYTGPNGVAATPNPEDGSASDSQFSDVRMCQDGGTFSDKCSGLLGCAGMNGAGMGGNDCSHGLSYSGTNPTYTNPANNCANIYTLARQGSAPSCDTDIAYDAAGATPDVFTMDSVTIPEGAWVTGYWSPSYGGEWSDGTGVCGPPTGNQTKYVVQMGCGRHTNPDGTTGLGAYATTYTYNATDGMTAIDKDNSGGSCHTVPMQKTTTDRPCSSTTIKGKSNSDNTCTFTGINQVVSDSGVFVGRPYQGYTFGFMPGYYNSNYATKKGPCT